MNKKKARKKKHVLDKKRKTAYQHLIQARYEKSGNEEPETLLGNLAPVEKIPMVVWSEIPVSPRASHTIELPISGKAAHIGELFREVSGKDHDLIGFAMVSDISQPDVREFAPGSIGMAAQVREIVKTERGTIMAHLYGICRFENLGFVPDSDQHLTVKTRWFEDDPEPEAAVAPQYREFLKNMARMARVAGGQPKGMYHLSLNARYDFMVAQWASFFPLGRKGVTWLTVGDKLELLALTSTAERLRRLNEIAERVLHDPRETIKNFGLHRVTDD